MQRNKCFIVSLCILCFVHSISYCKIVDKRLLTSNCVSIYSGIENEVLIDSLGSYDSLVCLHCRLVPDSVLRNKAIVIPNKPGDEWLFGYHKGVIDSFHFYVLQVPPPEIHMTNLGHSAAQLPNLLVLENLYFPHPVLYKVISFEITFYTKKRKGYNAESREILFIGNSKNIEEDSKR